MAERFEFYPETADGLSATPIRFPDGRFVQMRTFGGWGLIAPRIERNPVAGRAGVADQHGNTEDRIMRLIVTLTHPTPAEVQAWLDDVSAKMALLRGSNDRHYGILRRIRADGRVFDIRAALHTGLRDWADSSLGGSWMRVLALEFRAPSPLFHATSARSVSIETVLGRDRRLEDPQPLSGLINFGGDKHSAFLLARYAGDADSHFLTWEVEGPAINPVLVNRTDPLRRFIRIRGTIPPGQLMTAHIGIEPRTGDRPRILLSNGEQLRDDGSSPYPVLLHSRPNLFLHLHETYTETGPRDVSLRWRDQYLRA